MQAYLSRANAVVKCVTAILDAQSRGKLGREITFAKRVVERREEEGAGEGGGGGAFLPAHFYRNQSGGSANYCYNLGQNEWNIATTPPPIYSYLNKTYTLCSFLGHLTIGITSISRPDGANYLLKTIQSLLDNMNDDGRKQTFIVVFLADLDEEMKTTAAIDLLERFHKEIDEDLLHVIETLPRYYPELSNLKLKFGDSQGRTRWRSKQNIDFAFLMCYCRKLSSYYLHIEDDVIASPSILQKVDEFISSQTKSWPILDISAMGHVAKVYKSKDLENIASYFYLMYDEMPVDWLIWYWRNVKEPYNSVYIYPAASFFQHKGIRSSLKEKEWSTNISYDRYFDVYDHKYKGLNPPADVTSSITPNEGNPQDAYRRGFGYFWGRGVKINDHVTVKFNSAVNVKEVFVDTGSNLALKDWLKFGVLQASFASEENKGTWRAARSPSCGNFETVVTFVEGKVNVTFHDSRKVDCLRILVTQNQPEWLFLREIDVWEETQ